MRSKRSQQLLNARNNKIEIERQKEETRKIEENQHKWKEKQDSTPDAMMMVSTKNMQNIVNQLSCRDCDQTGEIVLSI